MIKTQNIKLYRGKSGSFSFVIKDEKDALIDLSSVSEAKLKVWQEIPGTNAADVIYKDLTIDRPEYGECSITLDTTDTAIDTAWYKYVLEFTFGAGDIQNLAYGDFIIIGDETTRIKEIKTKYGLTYDDYSMKSAYAWAKEQMLNNAFIHEEATFSARDDTIKLLNYVMDKNFDGVVDASDINVIEYQETSPYGINDLNANVSDVKFDHPTGYAIVTMDAEYPTEGYKLKLDYYRGANEYAKCVENVRRVEEMYTIYHLFDILEPYKLQKGLPDRSINGVTIVFDRDGIDQYKKKLWTDILNEIMKIRPFKGVNVLINKGY